jgi:hypothetical protein
MTALDRTIPGRGLWLIAVVLIAAVVAMLAAGAGAGTFTKARSTVRITSGNGSNFTIKVTSAKRACVKSRKVELEREGVKVGSGTTNASGIANLPGLYQAGDFFSIVKPNAHCTGARSLAKHF